MPHKHRKKKRESDKLSEAIERNGERYRLRGRFWIDGPDGTFVGYGRIVLLERIREYGSITKAAKSMNMSYRHAWRLIDSMNKQAPSPFVITVTGGKGGGGTIVTGEGEKAIQIFWRTYDTFQQFLQREGETLGFSAEET